MAGLKFMRLTNIAALVAIVSHVLFMAMPAPAESAEQSLARALQVICTIDGSAGLDGGTGKPAHGDTACDHCILCFAAGPAGPQGAILFVPDPVSASVAHPADNTSLADNPRYSLPPGRAPPGTPNT